MMDFQPISTHSGRIEQVIFESQALRHNALGDPFIRPLFIYLPPSYDADEAKRFPVLLMLSSHGNTAQSLLNWRAWDETIAQQLDRLILSGICPPHIMILPDTWTRFGGTLHLNTPAMGNYADYVLDEVIPYVDAHYRTLASANHRGVLGRSSGGYGAIYHAMTRPDLFSVVADHSGDSYFEFMALPEIAKLHMNLKRYGGLDGFMAESKLNKPKKGDFFDLTSMIAFAATFAPNADAPYGFDLPIDLETGALDDAVWQRCLSFDPVRMVLNPDYADALKNLKELFIDCGDFDEYNLQVGARLLSRNLHAMGVPHTYESYLGGHRGTHYRYDVSLPRLVKALI